jgi:hypothetical protein
LLNFNSLADEQLASVSPQIRSVMHRSIHCAGQCAPDPMAASLFGAVSGSVCEVAVPQFLCDDHVYLRSRMSGHWHNQGQRSLSIGGRGIKSTRTLPMPQCRDPPIAFPSSNTSFATLSASPRYYNGWYFRLSRGRPGFNSRSRSLRAPSIRELKRFAGWQGTG